MKNWIVRSLTGIVYIALIVGGIYLGNWWYLAMTLILALPAIMEFKRMTVKGRESNLNILIDLLGAAFLLFCCSQPIKLIYLPFYTIYFIARLISQIYTRDENPVASLVSSFAAQAYIALPIALMQGILTPGNGMILLQMFVLIWLSDTGAFIVGSLLGRHKLFPRLSPKKSWEGFFGGVIFCVGAAIAMYYLFNQPRHFADSGLLIMVGLGIIVPVFATLGDLVESMIKRTVGVKDSGSILPGHGGMLDRIDSLLLVAPATFIYLKFILFSITNI